MTALNKFAKLETTGLWRATPEEPRREVVVAFGKASITLSELRGQAILSHWSLPALLRRNPGQQPAIYTPGEEDDGESLELDDQMMIDAIATVQAALAKRRPRRGSVRMGVIGGIVAAVAAVALFWMPTALVSHTVGVVPFVKRQEIGLSLQQSMQRFTGTPCQSEDGNRALTRLSERLFPNAETKLMVLRDGLPRMTTLDLPGRLILIHQDLVESFDQPEVLAGHLLAAGLRAEDRDPLVDTLKRAGTRATFTLLATGILPRKTLDAQARDQLRQQVTPPSTESMLASFAAARLTATPYARSLRVDDPSRAVLERDDPLPPATAQPLIPDADWLALQAICQR